MMEMGFTFAIPSIKVYDVVQEIGGSSLTCLGHLFCDSEHIYYIGFRTFKMRCAQNEFCDQADFKNARATYF